MILAPVEDVHTDCRARHADDADTIRRLQELLTNALKQREHVVTLNLTQADEIAGLMLSGRHWFVDDGQGYCLACATVRFNGRHTPRRPSDRPE